MRNNTGPRRWVRGIPRQLDPGIPGGGDGTPPLSPEGRPRPRPPPRSPPRSPPARPPPAEWRGGPFAPIGLGRYPQQVPPNVAWHKIFHERIQRIQRGHGGGGLRKAVFQVAGVREETGSAGGVANDVDGRPGVVLELRYVRQDLRPRATEHPGPWRRTVPAGMLTWGGATEGRGIPELSNSDTATCCWASQQVAGRKGSPKIAEPQVRISAHGEDYGGLFLRPRGGGVLGSSLAS